MKKIGVSTIRSSLVYLLVIFTLIFIDCNRSFSNENKHPLKAEAEHKISSKKVSQLLRQYHYDHRKIDDAVSAEALDLFIKRYDRNRMYFLAADIEKFEQFRYTLDDEIHSGDLEAAYLIFNTLTTRVDERLAFIKIRLTQEFDYSTDESLQIDRSEAPWSRSAGELEELWRKKLKNEALNLKLADKDWKGIGETLTKRYANLKKRLDQYKSEDVFQDFMNAISETFDPHTSYFSPISSENFDINMSLSLQGIGAQLTTEDDFTKVVRIISGGPADRSKLIWANDKIVGVAQGKDGKMVDVIGMRLDDVVQKIRGPKGSIVRLEIIGSDVPEGSPAKEITLVRDKVVLEEQAAKSDTVEFMSEGQSYKLGIIDLPTFYVDLEAQRRRERDYKSTTRDVRRLIRELEHAGVDGIILDLRRNGGGSLQEAIALTGLFIEDGPVVQVKSSIGSKRVENDPDPALVYAGPLAVLVDRFSASASEIFASAIQDYGRGLIIGSQTYGKGTVQNLIGLNRFIRAGGNKKYGQLKVTIAKFYRITGGTTQHRGVIPDINFPSVYNEMDFGENKQLHALPWDEISPAIFRSHDQVSRFLSKLRLTSKQRTASDREFQYIQKDIARYLAEQTANSVSLRESVRKAKRGELESRDWRRANERRLAKNLEPLQEGEKVAREDKAPDAILEESKLIMANLVALTNPDRATEIARTEALKSQSSETGPHGTVKVNEGQKIDN